MFPYVAAAFPLAACTKHALTEGESVFRHICLALNRTRDRNLDSKYHVYSHVVVRIFHDLTNDTKILHHQKFVKS